MANKVELDDTGKIVLRINWKAFLKVFIVLALSIGSYFLPLDGLGEGGSRCLAIFVGAAKRLGPLQHQLLLLN